MTDAAKIKELIKDAKELKELKEKEKRSDNDINFRSLV